MSSSCSLESVKPEDDSYDRILCDKSKNQFDYWGCTDLDCCQNCPSKIGRSNPNDFYGVNTCREAQLIDLGRRKYRLSRLSKK